MNKALLIFLFLLGGCIKKDPVISRKEIVGLVGCSESEANADIEESLNAIRELVSGKIDSIYVKKGQAGCGYEFVKGDLTKTIEGASTDVDLMVDANEFFGFPGK